MQKQGVRYVSYADCFSIYVKSKSEAIRIGNSMYLFLRDKLKLPINKSKSGICRPVNFELLRHGFVPIYKKGIKGQYQLVVKQASWEKFKRNLKSLTKKTKPMSLLERLE
jgi:RNA-directed DNA polymerase